MISTKSLILSPHCSVLILFIPAHLFSFLLRGHPTYSLRRCYGRLLHCYAIHRCCCRGRPGTASAAGGRTAALRTVKAGRPFASSLAATQRTLFATATTEVAGLRLSAAFCPPPPPYPRASECLSCPCTRNAVARTSVPCSDSGTWHPFDAPGYVARTESCCLDSPDISGHWCSCSS